MGIILEYDNQKLLVKNEQLKNTITQLKKTINILNKNLISKDEINIILRLLNAKYKEEKLFFIVKDSKNKIIYPKEINVLKKITNILDNGKYCISEDNDSKSFTEIYDEANNKFYKYSSSTHYIESDQKLKKYTVDFLQDISREKYFENESKIDYITGTYNIRTINNKLEEYIINEETDFNVAICDIDNFKNINDTYTHEGGNLILKEITSIFKKHISNIGYVGRFGGDEFILIFKNLDPANSLNKIQDIINDIRNIEITFDNKIIKNISISCGIYQVSKPYTILSIEDVENIKNEILYNADKALYKSKENGKNQASIYTENKEKIK